VALALSKQLLGEKRASALITFWKFSSILGDGFTPQLLELFFTLPEQHAFDFVAVLTELRVHDHDKKKNSILLSILFYVVF
jgi:hypothetical protein